MQAQANICTNVLRKGGPPKSIPPKVSPVLIKNIMKSNPISLFFFIQKAYIVRHEIERSGAQETEQIGQF